MRCKKNLKLTCIAPPLKNQESCFNGCTICVDSILLNFTEKGDDRGIVDIRDKTLDTVL